MQCWLRFLFHIFIPVVYRRCPKRNIVLVGQLCVFCRGILVEKIAPVMSIGLLMGLLRLCKISEMPQLGWECPGVSYWVWQNLKKRKKEKEEREQGGERERERQTGREEGRMGEQNKNNEKKIKTLICCNLLSKLWCPIISPSRVPILDCVVTCFTCLLVLAFIGWAVFGNGQVEWKRVFRNFIRLNIAS